jgi:hypothetical protein
LPYQFNFNGQDIANLLCGDRQKGIMDTRILRTYWYKDKEQEQRAQITLVLLFALIASFDQWGTAVFSVTEGLYNFFWSILAVGGSFLIVDALKRSLAIKKGYIYELQVMWYGIGMGVLLTFASGGYLKPYIGPTFWLYDIPGHRLGKFPRRMTTKDFAKIGLFGVLANFVLANFAANGFFGFLPATAAHNMVIFNLVYASFAILPLPPLDGAKIFYNLFAHDAAQYSLPAVLAGIFSGYGVGYILGFEPITRFVMGFLFGVAFVLYYQDYLPHPKAK